MKWVTESNRPVNIVNDRELHDLLMASRPSINIPLNDTILKDIDAAFKKCQDCIAKLPQEHLVVYTLQWMLGHLINHLYN